MSDIREVIKRLEEATEGAPMLSRDIAEVMGTIEAPREEVNIDARTIYSYSESWPRYTESLDAALSLVPEGMGWQIVCPNPPHAAGIIHLNDAEDGTVEIGAATAPLALCIVCLRARFPEAQS